MPDSPGRLRVYLLGALDLDAVLHLQRALVYQLSGATDGAALLLCEHPPLVTIGRHGSPANLRVGPDELAARRWPVRWVSRGGGTFLHLPGQLAVYPILPLARCGLDVGSYVQRLQRVLLAVLADFGIRGQTRADEAGVWVDHRRIAAVGVAIRQQVTTFGATLNIDPDLTLYRLMQPGANEIGTTSVARERRGALRGALVRQLLIDHFRAEFGFEHVDLLFHPPGESGRLLPRPAERLGHRLK